MNLTENRSGPRQAPPSSNGRYTLTSCTPALHIASAGPRSRSVSNVISLGCSPRSGARTAGRWRRPSEKHSRGAHSAS